MTDQEMLQIYTGLVPFLAGVCGPGCEIVVHDVTDPEHSLIAIENSLSGRQVGDPLTDLSRELQEKGAYTSAAYIGNYEGKSKGRNFLSSTYFIKNEGRLIGLLCINKDMESLQNVNAALHSLLSAVNLYEAPEEQVPRKPGYSDGQLVAKPRGPGHCRKRCGDKPLESARESTHCA